MVALVTWELWKERNARTFENTATMSVSNSQSRSRSKDKPGLLRPGFRHIIGRLWVEPSQKLNRAIEINIVSLKDSLNTKSFQK